MEQKKLFEEDYDTDKLIPQFEVSIAARNATYSLIQPHLPECRQRVFEIILKHPEGVCNKQIAKEWGVPINCVTGRVTELRKMRLIESCGTTLISDHHGHMHPNTLWRAL